MAFKDLKRDELIEAVRYYKVDVDPDATKAQLSVALLDAGYTPEQWEVDRDAYENGVQDRGSAITTDDLNADDESSDDEDGSADAEVVDEESNTEEDAGSEEENAADEEPELVLVRFVGSNRTYVTGRFKFSQNKPFALMSPAELDGLNRRLFRQASKAEAAEFYN